MSLIDKLKKNNPVVKIAQKVISKSPAGNVVSKMIDKSPVAKLVTKVLKPADNVATVSPVSVSVGVAPIKGDMFSVGLPISTSSAPVTSPTAGVNLPTAVINIQPTPEGGGGISGDYFSTSQTSSSQTDEYDGLDSEETLPIQKKVSSWLSKFLPTVETDVNFPDRRPLYIAIGGIFAAILLYKLVKKR